MTNAQTTLAWGQLASCYLQWALASGQPEALTNAVNAFQKVIEAQTADATARSIAKVGRGVVREAQARIGTSVDEQRALWKLALEDYLDVFNGKDLRANEELNLFWTQKAGLSAGGLAEKLGWWPQAVNVYQRLKELLPAMSESFDNRIKRAQEHLSAAKIN